MQGHGTRCAARLLKKASGKPAAETLGADPAQPLRQGIRLIHENRGVGSDALAATAAEQPANGLAGDLAEQIPQRDVDPTDGVRDGSAATEPEGVLVELLAHALRFEGVLAAIERLEDV